MNPLKDCIRDILERTPGGLSEYDLICRLQESGARFPGGDASYEMLLFRKHFLVMNALYQLRASLLEERSVYLHISPLLIRMQALAEPGSRALAEDHGESRVADYYLDWSNFENTMHTDVRALLHDFWRRYYAVDRRSEALTTLGLGDDADWDAVQQAYRRLAALHHPDRGGDTSRFVAIRTAYETLSLLRDRSARRATQGDGR